MLGGARWKDARRISGVWLPWPGKRSAVDIVRYFPAGVARLRRECPQPPAGGSPRTSGGYAAPPSKASADQPETLGVLNGLGAISDLELVIDRARVLFDRVGREVKLRTDLAVGRTGGDLGENLSLAGVNRAGPSAASLPKTSP